MLAETYAWFTQGFETADLHAAKELLQDLRESDVGTGGEA